MEAPRPVAAEVLVTGATGFIGKVVVAELLRQRRELGVAAVDVLVRPGKGRSAGERLVREVLESPALARLEAADRDRVRLVAGDVRQPRCGLAGDEGDRLGARLTHVIHCAASVEFDRPATLAVADNVSGALNVLELARLCPRLEQLVTTSTAYVTPYREDLGAVEEALVPLHRPAAELRAAVEARHGEGAAEAVERDRELLAETGHPNTYTLSKCLAEHLLAERRGHVPLCIVRPSIVSAAQRHPLPGWIDSRAAFAGLALLVGGGYLRVIAGRPDARLDVVPVDHVADCLIDAAFGPRVDFAIRHAVAGPDASCTIAECVEVITRVFGGKPLARRPEVRCITDDDETLELAELKHHRLPARTAGLWFTVKEERARRKQLDGLGLHLDQVRCSFRYFTTRSFEFRSSYPLPADFRRHDYITLTCHGIHRHLAGPRGQRSAPPPTPRRRAAFHLLGNTLRAAVERVLEPPAATR